MPSTLRAASRCRGFTLVEVIVSMALIVVISIGVAQLFVVATTAVRNSRDRTIAITLATGKLEQLRSLVWQVDVADDVTFTARTDLESNVSSEPVSAGGPGLRESPANSLDNNVPPYVDYLGRLGQRVGAGASPPGNAVYIRRWAVRHAAADPERLLALQVLVTTVARERSRQPGTPHVWNGDDVVMATAITRFAR